MRGTRGIIAVSLSALLISLVALPAENARADDPETHLGVEVDLKQIKWFRRGFFKSFWQAITNPTLVFSAKWNHNESDEAGAEIRVRDWATASDPNDGPPEDPTHAIELETFKRFGALHFGATLGIGGGQSLFHHDAVLDFLQDPANTSHSLALRMSVSGSIDGSPISAFLEGGYTNQGNGVLLWQPVSAGASSKFDIGDDTVVTGGFSFNDLVDPLAGIQFDIEVERLTPTPNETCVGDPLDCLYDFVATGKFTLENAGTQNTSLDLDFGIEFPGINLRSGLLLAGITEEDLEDDPFNVGDKLSDVFPKFRWSKSLTSPGEQSFDLGATPEEWLDFFDPIHVRMGRPVCSDGLDNDNDGWTDAAEDPGCGGDPNRESERAASAGPFGLHTCDDGMDNDGDGKADYPDDEGCKASWSFKEDPACSDGVDNDRVAGNPSDGIDFGPLPTNDPECATAWDASEKQPGSQCGIGAELAFLLPPLMWLYSKRRSRT